MEWIYGLIDIICCLIEAFLMIDFFAAFFSIREKFEKNTQKWSWLFLQLFVSD